MNNEPTEPEIKAGQAAPSNQGASEPVDYSKPVAYDTNGRPLYAHPPQESSYQQNDKPSPPQIVQMTRPLDPVAPHIGEAALERHKKSIKDFPTLNLSEGEYIISAVRRHPIGLLSVFGGVGIVYLVLIIAVALYADYVEQSPNLSLPPVAGIALIALLFGVLVSIGAFMAYYVYMNNKFFLTNESVIQEIQNSIFSKHEQTVSLANIEDASYRQEGFLQHMFNYGSIRLSTEGDETTYRFNYVSNPKKQIATLNNAVESFKNGRPVLDN
jgi:hypothetical protein